MCRRRMMIIMNDNKRVELESSSYSNICDLPIEVVHNILERLPIRDVVRTCLLTTKRWQQLWRSMPCLIFYRYFMEAKSPFINYMHKLCTLRDPNYPIQRLEVESEDINLHDASLIGDSIKIAVKSRVQYLLINIDTCVPCHVLPYCVFRSETLMKLHISLSSLHPQLIILPDTVSLPSLKVLYLEKIEFADLGSIQQLCSCPILEDVDIRCCCWKSSSRDTDIGITISAPNLKRMFFFKVEVVCPLRWVCCESVKEFSYIGSLRYELHVSGTSNTLDGVRLDFQEGTVTQNALNLINNLSTTTRLTLSSVSEVFDSWTHLVRLARFDNLMELTLFGPMSFRATVHSMLQKSPCLQYLHLQGWHYVPTGIQAYVVGEVLHTQYHLRKIGLIYNHGRVDVDVVAMLLMCSPVLEVMVLEVPPSCVADLSRTLTQLPKASQDCRILYR